MLLEEVEKEVELQLKEEGKYYEYLYGFISNIDYERIKENLIIAKIEDYNSKGVNVISLIR